MKKNGQCRSITAQEVNLPEHDRYKKNLLIAGVIEDERVAATLAYAVTVRCPYFWSDKARKVYNCRQKCLNVFEWVN
jgi:hypothetical protein